MGISKKFKKWLAGLHGKKHHLDLIIALLTIPVLLTVIISNLINFQKSSKNSAQPTPPQAQKIIIQAPTAVPQKIQPVKNAVVPISNCKKVVGPISISFPAEGQTVSDNPVCITIKYDDPNYCSVVWSYRINGGSWSDYSSNSVCFNNLSNGNTRFDLRVQSTVSQDQTSISRSFNYQSDSGNVASSSAK